MTVYLLFERTHAAAYEDGTMDVLLAAFRDPDAAVAFGRHWQESQAKQGHRVPVLHECIGGPEFGGELAEDEWRGLWVHPEEVR